MIHFRHNNTEVKNAVYWMITLARRCDTSALGIKLACQLPIAFSRHQPLQMALNVSSFFLACFDTIDIYLLNTQSNTM